MKNADDVLQFWFVDHGPDDWFGGKPEFDGALSESFAETHARVGKAEAWTWRHSPAGRLAEIIVLDQFSRQLHRGNAQGFAWDSMALALAQEALALDADHAVEAIRRPFFYLPFMHSESIIIQHEGVRLYQALGDPEQLQFMLDHLHAIERFGRFPFRNKALGRTSTPEEEHYMAEAGDRRF
ncbi:DUF924 family protein [Devosia sp. 1566]|uniref:DUF924 family protein n=1 Tax=Devosia sp. 1566 TaxID=2499144 RepID=UPI000FD6C9DB|nr:DUF924 family protein [Devosia sp. 1566]